MIELTLIENAGRAPLTKQFDLQGGQLCKRSSAPLSRGRAKRVVLSTITDLTTLIEGLERHQALIHGLTDRSDVAVVTKDALREHPDAISRSRKYFHFRVAPSVMLLDYDPRDGAATLSAGELRDILISACPALADAPMAAVASASSHIYHDERQLKGAGGLHLYVIVADGSDIERAGRTLYEHLWKAGHGYYAVSKSGQLLDRNLIDASVWEPERLDYAAGAFCVPPLEQRRPNVAVWNTDAEPLDTTRLIVKLSPEEADTAAAHRGSAQAMVEPERKIKRSAYRDERVTEVRKRGIDEERAGVIIDQALDRKVLLGDFILTTADGKQVTVTEVLKDKRRFNEVRFNDPLEPDYRGDTRIAHANLFSGGRPYIYSHAHGGQRFELHPQPRVLERQRGGLQELMSGAIDLLRIEHEVYDQPVSTTKYRMVYVREGTIVEADDAWLRGHLGDLIQCTQFDVRTQSQKNIDIPPELPALIRGRNMDRNLPKLEAVISDPVMRPDGTVLDTPGYSEGDRLLYVSKESERPGIPTDPTDEQIGAAFKVLWRPFQEFPFVDDASRGVLLAALLTAAVRAVLPTSPAFAFDAPTAGSGKTLLAECVSLVRGVEAPVQAPPKTDEEQGKALFAALRGGARIIFWDNFNQAVEGRSAICAFITGKSCTARVLQVSEQETFLNRAMLLLTGNNIRTEGDVVRRILKCRIDAGLEQPWRRSFDIHPPSYISAHRAEILAALLTILRAFQSRGAPKQTGADTNGGFEVWDAVVRQAVVWLGKSGLTGSVGIADPVPPEEESAPSDPQSEMIDDLMTEWQRCFGGKRVSPTEVIRAADEAEFGAENDGLRAALNTIAGEHLLTSRRLGGFLQQHRDEIIRGRSFVQYRDPSTGKYVYSLRFSEASPRITAALDALVADIMLLLGVDRESAVIYATDEIFR